MIRVLLAGVLLLFATQTTSGQTVSQRQAKALQQLAQLPADIEMLPGRVIVKFAGEAQRFLGRDHADIPALLPLYGRLGISRLTQLYPGRRSTLAKDGSEIALQRMYLLEFDSGASPLEVARELCALPDVEYAEPELVQKLFYTPDDPMLAQQYALEAVKAHEAWDISTGSRDVVIAIVDSGVRWTHEDMRENIWVNPGEDIDGDGLFTTADLDSVDNDANGYIDDIIGIDFVGPSAVVSGTYYDSDPNPTGTGNPHGTHVAGIAAARGNNAKGIAGLAFNCRIMPIKCAPDVYTASILRGYDGIVYAADNGADVINCSWGGGGYMLSQQERIAYAVAKGAVVVAAAGNSGDERVHTPGAYPNVLCVANVGPNDAIAGSSTHGPWVDVSAPGTDILSSVSTSDQAYQAFSGTSMASPLVAGLAGLVKSVFPQFTAEQVFEQIRVTSDPIDTLQNKRYHGKIGRGRVNAFRALTEQSPGVRLLTWSWSDSLYGNNNGIAEQGERLTITMRWKNYLAPTSSARMTLSVTGGNATVERGEFLAGLIATNGEAGNESDPFVIALTSEFVPNSQVDLRYDIEDGEYRDNGGVFFIQQPSYRDHDVNDVVMTLTSDGNVGFDDMSGVMGSGFRYKGEENILFEGALMLGAIVNMAPLTVDVARSSGSQQLEDFASESLISMRSPGRVAEQEGRVLFEDLAAPLSYRLQVSVDQESFAFTRDGARNMVFLRYRIANTGTNVQEQAHAGLFFDWDIGVNSQTDIALFDEQEGLALAFDTTGTPRARTRVGVLPLNRAFPINYWGINNRDSDDTLRIGIYNGYSKAEKWKSLSTGVVQPVSQITDVSYVLAQSMGDLAPGDTAILGFAFIAGESSEEIIASIPRARQLWDTLMTRVNPAGIADAPLPGAVNPLLEVHPHPFLAGTSAVYATVRGLAGEELRCTLFDVLGRALGEVWRGRLAADRQTLRLALPQLSPGVYFLRAEAAGRVGGRRILVLR